MIGMRIDGISGYAMRVSRILRRTLKWHRVTDLRTQDYDCTGEPSKRRWSQAPDKQRCNKGGATAILHYTLAIDYAPSFV